MKSPFDPNNDRILAVKKIHFSGYFSLSKKLRTVSQQSGWNESNNGSGTISCIITMKIEKKSPETLFLWDKYWHFFCLNKSFYASLPHFFNFVDFFIRFLS